jgi:hypothetical protein
MFKHLHKQRMLVVGWKAERISNICGHDFGHAMGEPLNHQVVSEIVGQGMDISRLASAFDTPIETTSGGRVSNILCQTIQR